MSISLFLELRFFALKIYNAVQKLNVSLDLDKIAKIPAFVVKRGV